MGKPNGDQKEDGKAFMPRLQPMHCLQLEAASSLGSKLDSSSVSVQELFLMKVIFPSTCPFTPNEGNHSQMAIHLVISLRFTHTLGNGLY